MGANQELYPTPAVPLLRLTLHKVQNEETHSGSVFLGGQVETVESANACSNLWPIGTKLKRSNYFVYLYRDISYHLSIFVLLHHDSYLCSLFL